MQFNPSSAWATLVLLLLHFTLPYHLPPPPPPTPNPSSPLLPDMKCWPRGWWPLALGLPACLPARLPCLQSGPSASGSQAAWVPMCVCVCVRVYVCVGVCWVTAWGLDVCEWLRVTAALALGALRQISSSCFRHTKLDLPAAVCQQVMQPQRTHTRKHTHVDPRQLWPHLRTWNQSAVPSSFLFVYFSTASSTGYS